MSSGVSDQMKVPGNTAKSPEERNIPWSQQVDEASNENLSSPHADDNSDLQNPATANNYKTRKPFNNFDATKKHGKPSFYGNAKREDFPQNAWGSYNNTRRAISDNLPGNYNRTNKSDDGYISGNVDNKVEEKKVSAPQVAAPKKTTWASIASQPAKLTSRTTSITSSHKKKGPGMPPPPMVPGKHDLDVNTWDLPNNNPPPVPSPPPPIDQAFAEVTLNNAPGLPSDHVLGVRPEKSHKNADFHKQDDSAAHPGIYQGPNSFQGRLRASPNGHSRKNWSTQHPLHRPQAMAPNPAMTSGPMRRGPDGGGSNNLNHVGSGGPGGGGGPGSGNPSSNSSRYIVRGNAERGDGDRMRSHNVNSRLDYDSSSSSYNYRDAENTSRYTPADKRNSVVDEIVAESPQAVLESLRDKNNYNPKEIDFEKASAARFFVIKSYSEDDIHRSIKYEIWCSTDHGNKRLDDAFKERSAEGGNILLFFSVNGSGHFCGMAQMMTAVDYSTTSSVWSQDKWRGKFKVKWIYVKDVPNGKFRHIRLENNENKSVTNSRDTQEVPNAKGKEVLQILHSYKHTTSIFDDFYHYEKKQEEEVSSKKPYDHPMGNPHQPPSHQQQMDRDGRGGIPQKHFSGSSSGGMGSFRERSSMQRGGAGGGGVSFHNNYNNDRRFDNHRTTGSNNIGSNIPPSYSQKERSGERDAEGERGDGGDYGRHMGHKFDYNRRDERMKMKYNSRERDFSEEHGNGKAPESGRYRTISRETQKDNEYSNTVRVRGSNDY